MSTTYLLKSERAPCVGVAVRLHADGREAWRKEFDWPAPDGHGSTAGAERADVTQCGASEAAAPAQFTGDLFRDAAKMVPVQSEPRPLAPFAAGSPTSHAAALAIEPHMGADAERVLRCIRSGGEHGRTCQEVERLLDMPHETASARVNGLVKAGRVVRTERTRPTESGRGASVLVAVSL